MTREEEYLQRRMEEAVQLCTEFLLTNSSDIDLASKTGISSSNVGRILTNKELIEQAYPEIKRNLLELGYNENLIPENGTELFKFIRKKRQENLMNGKRSGSQTTFLNYMEFSDDDKKNSILAKTFLNKIYPTEEKQYKFLAHCMLFFKLHLYKVGNLFQIDENTLYENINKYCPNLGKYLEKLFIYNKKNQDEAFKNFFEYYKNLFSAVKANDENEVKKLFAMIGDSKAAELKRTRKKGDLISEEDIETLVMYQLKYSLTINDIAKSFNIQRAHYSIRVGKFLEKNKELEEDYRNLYNYNCLLVNHINEVRRG